MSKMFLIVIKWLYSFNVNSEMLQHMIIWMQNGPHGQRGNFILYLLLFIVPRRLKWVPVLWPLAFIEGGGDGEGAALALGSTCSSFFLNMSPLSCRWCAIACVLLIA